MNERKESKKNIIRIILYLIVVNSFVWGGYLVMEITGAIPFIFLMIGSWIPNISAFLVLGLLYRKPGAIKNLLKRWTIIKVPLRWYGFVIVYPLIILAVFFGYLLTGELDFPGNLNIKLP